MSDRDEDVRVEKGSHVCLRMSRIASTEFTSTSTASSRSVPERHVSVVFGFISGERGEIVRAEAHCGLAYRSLNYDSLV